MAAYDKFLEGARDHVEKLQFKTWRGLRGTSYSPRDDTRQKRGFFIDFGVGTDAGFCVDASRSNKPVLVLPGERKHRVLGLMEGERWEPNVNVETGNWDIVFTKHSGIRPEFPKDLADRLSVILSQVRGDAHSAKDGA